MLVMVVFFIAFSWIHLSTPLIRLFLFVLILLLMPTLNFFPLGVNNCIGHFFGNVRRIWRAGAKYDLETRIHKLDGTDQMDNSLLPGDAADKQEVGPSLINSVLR